MQKKTFCNQIKIQKTTSGKYFVNWWFDKIEDNSCYSEKGKNCFSAEKMPEILTLHQECWENNDWSRWEKELKDNYLLVKEKIKGENGQFQYQTRYESHPTSQADREEEEAQQRIKQAERVREECRKRARKWKEEHKNGWRTCQKCGKYFCLENEFTVSENGGEPEGKIEYFCGECSKK